jgi:hypothetical protein
MEIRKRRFTTGGWSYGYDRTRNGNRAGGGEDNQRKSGEDLTAVVAGAKELVKAAASQTGERIGECRSRTA